MAKSIFFHGASEINFAKGFSLTRLVFAISQQHNPNCNSAGPFSENALFPEFRETDYKKMGFGRKSASESVLLLESISLELFLNSLSDALFIKLFLI